MKYQIFTSCVSRSRNKHSLKWMVSFCAFLFMFLYTSFGYSQNAVEQWRKHFSGSGIDNISSWIETVDGYLIGGSSSSGVGTDKTQASRGGNDYWIIKTDKNGKKLWDKTFGGSGEDLLEVIISTSDGGILLAGSSNSPASGEKTQASVGYDFWAVKISSTGVKQWDRTIGGASDQIITSAVSFNGGSLLGGNHSFSKTKADGTNYQTSDYFVVNISNTGVLNWTENYSGAAPTDSNPGSDILTSVGSTPDGGFLIGGHSNSLIGNDKTQSNLNEYDYWLVKVNSSGLKAWDKIYDFGENDQLEDILLASDGGFVLAGIFTSIHYVDEYYFYRYNRGRITKIDNLGTPKWDEIYDPARALNKSNPTFNDITSHQCVISFQY